MLLRFRHPIHSSWNGEVNASSAVVQMKMDFQFRNTSFDKIACLWGCWNLCRVFCWLVFVMLRDCSNPSFCCLCYISIITLYFGIYSGSNSRGPSNVLIRQQNCCLWDFASFKLCQLWKFQFSYVISCMLRAIRRVIRHTPLHCLHSAPAGVSITSFLSFPLSLSLSLLIIVKMV